MICGPRNVTRSLSLSACNVHMDWRLRYCDIKHFLRRPLLGYVWIYTDVGAERAEVIDVNIVWPIYNSEASLTDGDGRDEMEFNYFDLLLK